MSSRGNKIIEKNLNSKKIKIRWVTKQGNISIILCYFLGFFKKIPKLLFTFFSDLQTLSDILRFTHPVSKRYTDITEIPSCVRKYQILLHSILVLSF